MGRLLYFGRLVRRAGVQFLVCVVGGMVVNPMVANFASHPFLCCIQVHKICSSLNTPRRFCLAGKVSGLDCLHLLVFGRFQAAKVKFACFLKFTNRKRPPAICMPTSSVSLHATKALGLEEDAGIFKQEEKSGISSTGLITCGLPLSTWSPTNAFTTASLTVCTTVFAP